MNIHEFAKKYMGKTVRDGQCVALFRQYAEECFGIPHTGTVSGAIDLWMSKDSNPLIKQYFEIIDSRSSVKEGDAVIWNPTKTNQWGHVNMVLEVHGDGFSTVEQDGIKLTGVKEQA